MDEIFLKYICTYQKKDVFLLPIFNFNPIKTKN